MKMSKTVYQTYDEVKTILNALQVYYDELCEKQDFIGEKFAECEDQRDLEGLEFYSNWNVEIVEKKRYLRKAIRKYTDRFWEMRVNKDE